MVDTTDKQAIQERLQVGTTPQTTPSAGEFAAKPKQDNQETNLSEESSQLQALEAGQKKIISDENEVHLARRERANFIRGDSQEKSDGEDYQTLEWSEESDDSGHDRNRGAIEEKKMGFSILAAVKAGDTSVEPALSTEKNEEETQLLEQARTKVLTSVLFAIAKNRDQQGGAQMADPKDLKEDQRRTSGALPKSVRPPQNYSNDPFKKNVSQNDLLALAARQTQQYLPSKGNTSSHGDYGVQSAQRLTFQQIQARLLSKLQGSSKSASSPTPSNSHPNEQTEILYIYTVNQREGGIALAERWTVNLAQPFRAPSSSRRNSLLISSPTDGAANAPGVTIDESYFERDPDQVRNEQVFKLSAQVEATARSLPLHSLLTQPKNAPHLSVDLRWQLTKDWRSKAQVKQANDIVTDIFEVGKLTLTVEYLTELDVLESIKRDSEENQAQVRATRLNRVPTLNFGQIASGMSGLISSPTGAAVVGKRDRINSDLEPQVRSHGADRMVANVPTTQSTFVHPHFKSTLQACIGATASPRHTQGINQGTAQPGRYPAGSNDGAEQQPGIVKSGTSMSHHSSGGRSGGGTGIVSKFITGMSNWIGSARGVRKDSDNTNSNHVAEKQAFGEAADQQTTILLRSKALQSYDNGPKQVIYHQHQEGFHRPRISSGDPFQVVAVRQDGARHHANQSVSNLPHVFQGGRLSPQAITEGVGHQHLQRGRCRTNSLNEGALANLFKPQQSKNPLSKDTFTKRGEEATTSTGQNPLTQPTASPTEHLLRSSSQFNAMKLMSMTEDGVLKEISSQSSIATLEEESASSSLKDNDAKNEDEPDELATKYKHLIFDDRDIAQSFSGASAGVTHRWTASTKSESEEERLFKFQQRIKQLQKMTQEIKKDRMKARRIPSAKQQNVNSLQAYDNLQGENSLVVISTEAKQVNFVTSLKQEFINVLTVHKVVKSALS